MSDDQVNDALRNLEQDMAKNMKVKSNQENELRVKCEFNGEKRQLKTFKRPLHLADLTAELKRRYALVFDITFVMPNPECNFSISTQSDLDYAVKIFDGHQHQSALRLLLTAQPDQGRFSPPPGTLPPGAESCLDTSSQMTASTCSEGEFIPEPGMDSSSISSMSDSRQSLDRLAGSRASVFSESALGNQHWDCRDRADRAGIGGTFPMRMAPRIEDGKYTYPRQRQVREACFGISYGSIEQQSPQLQQQQQLSAAPVNWVQRDLLGQGAFGKVYKIQDVDSGRVFAMKAVQIETNRDANAGREVKALQKEIQLLNNIHHERIVRYYGCHEDSQRLCIFMEYMDGGSVRDEIKKYGPLKETLARKYTRMVLEGLQFLHHNLILHRDIKCANLLRDSQGNVKLSDFGASKRLMNLQSHVSTTLDGTAPYIAPEAVRGKKLTGKADIWSLGATVVEFLTGNPPYHSMENVASVLYRIVSEPTVDFSLPAGATPQAHDFVRSCFTYAAEQRPSADQQLGHPFCSEENN